ncbi:MAG: hypothetical protein ACJ762_05530 [Solirubrobacteraceae bacterium]
MLRRLTTAAVVALSLLVPASSALASGDDVLIDCNDHGRLTKDYSQKEYRDALSRIPADLKQYTDCENIIRRAQLGQRGTSEANAGTPFAGATPEEQAAAEKDIAEAAKVGRTPQRIGGAVITPGALAYTKVSAATTELPTPLLVLVALILLGTVGFAINHVMSRRRERAGEPGA